MEEGKTTKNFDLLYWVSVAYLVFYLFIKLSEWFPSKAIVYTIPPKNSQNGKESETGETVTSLVKEPAEHE